MKIKEIVIVFVMVLIDQLSKFLATRYLQPIRSTQIIRNVLDFTYVLNDGMAFGLFRGGRWFFVIVTVAILGAIIFYYRKIPKGKANSWLKFSLMLVMAGAIGNFIDRLRTGYVVDFIHVRFVNFPVFNIADIYVSIGAALMFVLVIFFVKDEKGQKDA
ncbi:MAG: signal peptidase II [Defluviitaleaceae bacterium]|nr:signal peptidase II [Defluviitaleaceae bacterium]